MVRIGWGTERWLRAANLLQPRMASLLRCSFTSKGGRQSCRIEHLLQANLADRKQAPRA
jgi:hypothetical protein